MLLADKLTSLIFSGPAGITAAADLVRKTGQQGVPQTDIEGSYVVGFDKKRINELLGINQ